MISLGMIIATFDRPPPHNEKTSLTLGRRQIIRGGALCCEMSIYSLCGGPAAGPIATKGFDLKATPFLPGKLQSE